MNEQTVFGETAVETNREGHGGLVVRLIVGGEGSDRKAGQGSWGGMELWWD